MSIRAAEPPEIVRIDALSSEYEAAEMPHGKIITTLRRDIEASGLAMYFHGREDALCQGCHHQSPLAATPPLCQSCHGAESGEADALKPGLRAAYHLQCLGCHKAMGIEEPKDCIGCHREKRQSGIRQ